MHDRNAQSNAGVPRSLLSVLRQLTPVRDLTFTEALRIAELQASRFRELLALSDDALPEDALTGLPRIRVVRRRLPTSGLSYWDGQCWVIGLNIREPEARQRFTLCHEYKHVVDHGRTDRLYRGYRQTSPSEQAEQAADYFAGCLLMPKRLVKRAWGHGVQTPGRLADLFEVSPRAIEVRLAQLGLTEPAARCSRSVPTRGGGRYYRRAAIPLTHVLEGALAA